MYSVIQVMIYQYMDEMCKRQQWHVYSLLDVNIMCYLITKLTVNPTVAKLLEDTVGICGSVIWDEL